MKKTLVMVLFFAFFRIGVSAGIPDVNKNRLFIENKGQLLSHTDQQILFYSQDQTNSVYCFSNKISFVYRQNSINSSGNQTQNGLRIDYTFLNHNDADIKSIYKQQATYNFYLGHIPDGITDVSLYKKIKYENFYNNIDVECQFRGSVLKYDFVVHPGGDPDDISFIIEGAEKIEYIKYKLIINSSYFQIKDSIPKIYQIINGKRVSVNGNFVLNKDTVSFNIAEYNRKYPLIIDPEVLFSTFFGGQNFDIIRAINEDKEGNILITGNSASSDFPTRPGAFQENNNGDNDMFVSKFTSDDDLIWSTFYGGSSNDHSSILEIDSENSIWSGSESRSGDFPVTSHSLQQGAEGLASCSLVKFDKNGKRLISILVGGGGYDAFADAYLDSQENIWLTGRTTSGGFPTTKSNTSHKGDYDIFLIQFSKDGLYLQSQCYGTIDGECGLGITVNSNDEIFVTGLCSSDLPGLNPNAVQYHGAYDAFLAKFDKNGDHEWTTYVGGSNNDVAHNIVTDEDDNIYINGYARSNDLQVSDDAMQKENAGNSDMFIAKLTSSGDPIWSTYYGGSSDEGRMNTDDYRGGLSFRKGNLAVAGFTESGDLPIYGDPVTIDNQKLPERMSGTDGFVLVFDAYGRPLLSTFLSGIANDYPFDSYLVSSSLWIVGMTESRDFPVTDDAFQKNHVGGYDGFITKIGLDINESTQISVRKEEDKCGIVHDLFVDIADSIEGKFYYYKILTLENCSLTDGNMSNKSIYLQWTVSDPTLQSVFSVHIKGDIELDTVITVTTIPLTNLVQVSYDGDKKIDFGQILFGEILCDSLLIENFDDDSVIIEAAYFLDNTNFSVPPGQLPMFIGPKQSAFLTVCWEASDKPANPNVDTLLIETDCFDFTFPATGEALIDAELNVSFANDSCGILNEMFVEFGNETSEEIVSCEIVSAENCSLVDSAVHVKDVFLKWRIHNPNLQSVFACRIVGKSVLDTVITMVRAPMPAEFELSYNGKTAIDYDSCIIGELICKEVQLTNHSSESIIIDKAFFLGNINFSVPQKQLPIIVAAGETVDILLCWEALDAKVNPYRDTLYVQSECFFALLPAVAQALPYESGGKTVCRQDIKIVQKDIKNGFYDEYYPNPAGGSVAILIGLSESAQVAVEIYNLLGEKIDTKHPGSIEKGLSEIHIDCDSYSSGTYITVLLVNGQKTDTKIFHKL